MATKSNNGDQAKGTASKPIKAKKDAAQGLRDLMINQLNDIYGAEKTLTEAIPKMIDNATTQELINALSEHLKVTKKQINRLEQIFKSMGIEAELKNCEAMDGLVKEAEEIMKMTQEGVVRDAGIIAAAQKVEHYEIASYGTLASFAEMLGEDEAFSLLEETLNEEKEADSKLTAVSEAVNEQAMD